MRPRTLLIAAGLLLIYGFLIYSIYIPAFRAFNQLLRFEKKTTLLRSQWDQLNLQEQHLDTLDQSFRKHINFSEDQILGFIFEMLEKLPLQLLDYQWEHMSTSDSTTTPSKKIFTFQIEGSFEATLKFMNAFEESFPFVSIEDIRMNKLRVKKNFNFRHVLHFITESAQYGAQFKDGHIHSYQYHRNNYTHYHNN